MSTFDGHVAEFPDIRIDYFRSSPGTRPPLAYFLSHVHSDHLVGLETCKSPFIYCSPATRDILLRLEKYPHRMNFARGILETRTQTYRHLRSLLKAIPFETPTVIELAPGKEVRVTLFDANHCVGACMFLIEGGGKAVLYTGDIRSEAWWVDSLKRQPVLLPYAFPVQGGPIKRLDCIYLDTTFVVTGKEDPLRDFAPKAQGIDELLRKVAQYPSGTLFYFDAWTFGYEDVWQALSSFLDCGIHVDAYRHGVYLALANTDAKVKAAEAQQMIGYICGNHYQRGCLTGEQSQVHSCEKGTGCEIWDKDFVRITPIVARYNGIEIAELGAGGGQSDLNQRHELEVLNSEQVGDLMAFCTRKLQGQPQILAGVLQLLSSVVGDGLNSIELDDFTSTAQTRMSEPDEIGYTDLDGMPLEKLVPALAKVVTNMKLKKSQSTNNAERSSAKVEKRADGLPKQITFPYSRHSSYNELCLLLEAFKPKDIFPCTVDEAGWNPECSMRLLFDHIYDSPPSFRHDQLMLKKRGHSFAANAFHSRPGSAGSTSSEYATPDEDRSKGRKGGLDTMAQANEARESAVDLTSWSGLSEVDRAVPGSPVRNRWQKLIAQSRPTEEMSSESHRERKEGQWRQSDEYGQLSSRPNAVVLAEDERQHERQSPRSPFDDGPPKPGSTTQGSKKADTERSRKRSSEGRSGSESESDPRKRQKIGREVQGDYWPSLQQGDYYVPGQRQQGDNYSPVELPKGDYYSPADGRPSKRDTMGGTASRPDLADVVRAIPRSLLDRNHWRKVLEQSRIDEDTENERPLPRYVEHRKQQSLDYDRVSSHTNLLASALVDGDVRQQRRPPVQQSDEYGRLSPPPLTPTKMAKKNDRVVSTARSTDHIPSFSIRRRSSATKSNKVLSPKAKNKLAFRQEAYNAVLEIDGSSWNDIGGLVSVSGHQVKEEEL